MKAMIPIFVVDRPASLRILSQLDRNSNEFGILSHPYTTERFKQDFRNFECTLKIGDSGIFQGDKLTYQELFSEYVKMGVTFGVIKDYYRNSQSTYESATEAQMEYIKGGFQDKFELMGVAQGRSVAEYLENYRVQRDDLKLPVVAIGGLLDRIQSNIATVRVCDSTFLRNVLISLRIMYPQDRIFPFGVFNSRRLQFLKDIDVWASDYKGWIFRYDIERSHVNNDRYQQIAEYVENNVFKSLTPEVKEKQLSLPYMKRVSGKKRLLMISCGKRKSDKPGRAIDVYVGNRFRTIRKYLKSDNGVDIRIISAKYGPIDYKDRILPYNLRMDLKSAEIYKKIAESSANDWLDKYEDVFLVGAKEYQQVFPQIPVERRAHGKNGEQGQQLRHWLYGARI